MKARPFGSIMGALIVFFLATFATAQSNNQSQSTVEGPSADLIKSIRAVLYSIYSRDGAELRKWIIADPESDAVLPKKPLSPLELSELKREVEELEPHRVMPLLVDGELINVGAGSQYPVGAKTIYVTSFHGALWAIPVIFTKSGWKVDIRFWIAAAKKNSEREKPSDPEMIARQFLLYMMAKRPDKLSGLTASRIEPKKYTAANNLPPGDLDQLIELCFEMPLLRARSGESYRMPSGEIVRAGDEKDTVIVVGLYGVIELAFQLKYIGGKWKIVPQHYFEMLRALGAI